MLIYICSIASLIMHLLTRNTPFRQKYSKVTPKHHHPHLSPPLPLQTAIQTIPSPPPANPKKFQLHSSHFPPLIPTYSPHRRRLHIHLPPTHTHHPGKTLPPPRRTHQFPRSGARFMSPIVKGPHLTIPSPPSSDPPLATTAVPPVQPPAFYPSTYVPFTIPSFFPALRRSTHTSHFCSTLLSIFALAAVGRYFTIASI